MERTKTSPVGANHFEVRLTKNQREVEAAQRLRYHAFYEGMGVSPKVDVKRAGLDFDKFDAHCDHLLVIDRSLRASYPSVVGTYRLLRRSVADTRCGFYSAGEFDLSPLQNYPGEIVELGRSCVDARYRSKAIMQRLWSGLASYAQAHDITLMFGCASFPGVDPKQMATALSYLRHHHAAPKSWRPKALPGRYVEMEILKKHHVDERHALREMPPLIKGYLRVGGMVGEGAVIDRGFNTVDVCLLVEIGNVARRYRHHYLDYKDKRLVGVRGFEPPAPASRRRCSTRLSYTPMCLRARL